MNWTRWIVCSLLALPGAGCSSDGSGGSGESAGTGGAGGAVGTGGSAGAGTAGSGGSSAGAAGHAAGGEAGSPGVPGTGGASGAAGAGCGDEIAPGEGLITTDRGPVKGAMAGETWVYHAIPFAAPPVGALRWAPPVQAACWSETRDGSDWGAECAQLDTEGKGPVQGAEDCLQLNVWVPTKPAASPAPVLFWVHGGAFIVGGAAQLTLGTHVYDGQKLAEQTGSVVVSTNYRLGPLGFLAHPALAGADGASSGNLGLLDIMEALRWVQRNSKAIGADPSRVLLFGESAGGALVCDLVASPLTKGLFGAALTESGPCSARPRETSEQAGAKVIAAAKCDAAADVRACMQALPIDDLLLALPPVADVAGFGSSYNPVIDGVVLPAAPLSLIGAGQHSAVPMIVGTNSDETSKTVPLAQTASEQDYKTAVAALVGAQLSDAVLAHYPVTDYPSPWAAYVALSSDAKFICPTRRLARALAQGQTEPVYRYVYAHTLDNAPKQKVFGAAHGSEIPFVFGVLNLAGYLPSASEKALSDSIQGYWSRLGAKGDPNEASAVAWPAWGPTDPALRLDDEITSIVGVRTPQCDYWDTLSP